MSTPFEYIRRHQKVALTAVTGMAILSFLLVDVSNGGRMSPLALSSLIVGCFALVGWVWGTSDGKSSENAIFGGVLGLALTLVFMFMTRPPAAVTATSGNITDTELRDLSRTRMIANRMVQLVYVESHPNDGFMSQFMAQRDLPRLIFNFGLQNQTAEIVLSELLNREAQYLGVNITDDAVMAYLKEVAGKDADGTDKLTKRVYSEAIKNTCAGAPGTTEDTVIDAIRHELRARQAAKILVGGNRMTPADVWELHRKLNTRESAQLVSLPVEDFVDKTATPTEGELAEFFNTYKGNYPNSTPEGKLEEGRPGLYLPRRVRLAYLEANYEELEKAAGEVTEEEIKKRYEERYMKRAMPEMSPHGELNLPDLPVLPKVPKASEETPAPAPATGEAPAEKPAEPAAEKPAEPAAEKPAEEKPAEPAAPAAPATEEKPAAPATEASPPAEPAAPAPESKPEEPAKKPDGTSFRLRMSRLQPVALIEDAPAAPAEKPAESAPAAPAAVEEKPAEKPAEPATPAAEEKPAEPAAEKPVEEKPAEQPAAPPAETPAGEAPLTVPSVPGEAAGDEDPAPPSTEVRPLDEALRLQIRDELLAEKTRPLIEAKVNGARDFMSELHIGVAEYLSHQSAKDDKSIELSPDAITPEEASKRLKEYAEKNGLTYTETPLMSLEDLLQSEDHPLGNALVGRSRRVIDVIGQSKSDDLYTAWTGFDLAQKGNYAFWKIEDVAAHEPKSLDEAGVKELAIQSWRLYKARPAVEKRAQELADIVTKSDKPMAEALSNQTVTGKEPGIFVVVKSTGDFSWLQRSMAPSQSGQDNSPRFGTIQGVEKANDKFMAKIFNDMQPGGTAVVPNADRSVFYVMHIDKRTPSTEAEIAVMRKQFLESQGELSMYAQGLSQANDSSYVDRLFVKHGVKMSQVDDLGEDE